MTTAEHPITRSELREELKHYATKEDLANLKAEIKGDLGNLKFDLIKWIVVLQFMGLGAVAAIMRFLG